MRHYLAFTTALVVGAMAFTPLVAQDAHQGGVFTFAAESDPPTFDCHSATDFYSTQHLSPHYSTLLRYVPGNYPEITGDLAESWEVSEDSLTYTFKIHDNVQFHDGTPLTSADIKASYERIIDPPEGVVSPRQSELLDIASVETPDDTTVVFQLSEVNPGILDSLASPWNCIYSAKLLAENPDYPARMVMGSGPFVFEEFVPGSHWRGSRFEAFHREGKPHLDGFEIKRMDTSAIVNAFSAGQIQGYFRPLSPPNARQIESARGDEVQFQKTPSVGMNLLVFNSSQPPLDDPRVRRALALAVDQRAGASVLGQTSTTGLVGGLLRPGYSMALTPEELAEMPGFGEDVEAAREEARRLLQEAGQTNLTIDILSRKQNSHTAGAVFIAEQWQRIGVSAKVTYSDNPTTFQRQGNFQAAIDFNLANTDDPSVLFVKYLPDSPNNYGLYEDAQLEELFEAQKRTLDPAEREEIVHDFERRVLQEAYYIPLFWTERIIALSSDVGGFESAPPLEVEQSLENLWIAGED